MSSDNGVDIRLLSRGAPIGMAIKSAELEMLDSGNVPKYEYTKGVVSEYISNPANFLDRDLVDPDTKKVKGKVKDFMVNVGGPPRPGMLAENFNVSEFMPRNSILVFIQDVVAGNTAGKKPVIAYPFFPPHLSLPLKPGEHVWILKEIKGDVVFYYWQCRISTDRQIDDLNYTNFDRLSEVRILNNHFVQTQSQPVDDPRFLVPASSQELSPTGILPRKMTINKLHAESIAFMEEFTPEPIPKTSGKCSDLILQGSNNSTIQMTTEKFRPSEDIQDTTFLNGQNRKSDAFVHTPLAGAIDVFVGKEKERLIELKYMGDGAHNASENSKFNARIAARSRGGQSLENYENDKLSGYELGSENQFEGLDDPRNVFARMYLGMHAAPDESFEFNNQDYDPVSTHQIGPSAVMYADHTRIFAEDSIRFYNYPGNSVIDMTNDGTVTLQSGESDAASTIKLNPNGDVLINPVEKTGKKIYLGSSSATEDAVLGNILVQKLTDLCTALEVMTVGTAVGPSSPPINVAQITAVKTTLQQILSETTKVK